MATLIGNERQFVENFGANIFTRNVEWRCPDSQRLYGTQRKPQSVCSVYNSPGNNLCIHFPQLHSTRVRFHISFTNTKASLFHKNKLGSVPQPKHAAWAEASEPAVFQRGKLPFETRRLTQIFSICLQYELKRRQTAFSFGCCGDGSFNSGF